MALDMVETGIAMMRQNIRRRYPDESEPMIEQRLRTWLETAPAMDESQFRPAPHRFSDP